MAKPIPKKKAVVKEPVAAKKKLPSKVKARLAEISDKADTRYKWAKPLYDSQPEDVKAAVDSMTKMMKHMAGAPKFVMDGQTYEVDAETLKRIQRQSHLWIAMRMIVACAEWGIRIGNFKAPKGECIRCGKSVKKKAKKKK